MTKRDINLLPLVTDKSSTLTFLELFFDDEFGKNSCTTCTSCFLSEGK